jgi:dolichol kinase
MRDYEKNRIASFVWFASGSCLLLGIYEMGFFPQNLVIATIIMAAYTDPVIGEAAKKWGDSYGIICGLVCSFAIYQFIVGNVIYSLIGSVVAVISERPKIKWFDDDLAMQIIPMIVLVILNWFEILPDLVKEGIIIGSGA